MAAQVVLSPVTRIEGHLVVWTEVEPVRQSDGRIGHRIIQARCQGEMFRGFEVLLPGRDPLDAHQIVQRICGVCPISHGLASIKAQEAAYGIRPTRNGRRLQNLILAANLLQSHLLHFYQFVLPDYVDWDAARVACEKGALLAQSPGAGRAIAKLLACGHGAPPTSVSAGRAGRYRLDPVLNTTLAAHWAEALAMRRIAHEMAAIFGARMPHSTSLVPGGCTQSVTVERVESHRVRLERLRSFIDDIFLPDVVALARAFPEYWHLGGGYGHLLTYGSFDLDEAGEKLLGAGVIIGGRWEPLDIKAVTEEVRYTWVSSPSKLHPSQGRTQPESQKPDAYSWIKAPRYRGLPMEVGPLARWLVNYHSPLPSPAKPELEKLLAMVGMGPERLVSVWGRIVCRALEARLIARHAAQWLGELEPGRPSAQPFQVVRNGSGYGLVEAPRGALGHWLEIRDGKIHHYQCVVPTTWNCSPRDDAGQPGPVEKALEGLELADPQCPIEAGRVVRSFDPCLACAVH